MSALDVTRSSAQRLLDYLAAEFDETGSSRSAPDGIQYYYKMPATFALAGRLDLANATLDEFVRRFFASGVLDTAGDAMAKDWAPYIAGWTAWGAALLGRFDIGRAVIGSVMHFQAPDGGFRSAADGEAPSDVQRTGAALMGLAWNNEIAAAERAATFLRTTIEEQAGRSRFCALVDDGRPFADPNDRNTYFDVADPFARPAMFATPMAGLLWLYRLTGRAEHLAASTLYSELVLRHDSPAALPLATKIGWSSLMLHAHTGDDRLVCLARETVQWQARRQDADGSISFRDMEGSPQQIDKVWLVGWGCDCLLTLISVAAAASSRTGGTE